MSKIVKVLCDKHDYQSIEHAAAAADKLERKGYSLYQTIEKKDNSIMLYKRAM